MTLVKKPIRRYRYRRTLPHLLPDDSPVFVSFSTDKRWWLPGNARSVVLDCCKRQHKVTVEMFAVVVMPDHVHLVFRALRDENRELYSLP